ncbi:hypothetical protein ACJVC5_01565 [Peredibacter sp. HCB2-198]|uniref:hypothetical protein n=1 Tax=Peredibacter sp. HCB2-198 TaxID=3383025 RepID=UPI0038B53BBE
MKLIWINFLAIIIAITSVVVDLPAVEFNSEQLSGIHQASSWQSDSLRNSELRHSERTVHIAQDFIPIVLIAESVGSSAEFIHYLPIYSLARQKEYFLLI